MLSPKTIPSSNNESRIKVELKTLIDLATPARLLKQAKSAIKSQHSGGFISRIKGRGMEFDETRLYQAGDDIRSIDWRVSARTGKTYTKLYREERERAVFISVDYSPTMQFATRGVFKAVQAAKLAALLAWRAQHHGDRIGGQVFSGQHCLELKPHNGKQAVLRFFHALVEVLPQKNTQHHNLKSAISRLNHHIKPGSLVYLISDFRGLTLSCETHLAKLAQHCDVILIQIYDPLETHLPKIGRYRLTNGNQDLTLDANEQRIKNYQQKFQSRQNELQNLVKKLSIGLIQCSTSDNPLKILR